MKAEMNWFGFTIAFIVLISGSLGCATMLASSAVSNGNSDFYFKPVLTDEIVAIGHPDKSLSKEIGSDHAVAFIGLKNTYMLHKGGEELESISQLKLDGRQLDIDSARSYKLYLKDKVVWGELVLTYGSGSVVSAEEQAELEKAGFTQMKGLNNMPYQKKVSIEGMVYPAIKLPDGQKSNLGTHRAFNLYNSKDSKPPVIGKILKAPLIAVGVAADVALVPVYVGLLGVTAVVLVMGAASN